jgi:adenylyl- and sulfurtransferase ThiI
VNRESIARRHANGQFAVIVNSRNSHKLDRMEMIKTVAEVVDGLGHGHKVDLGNPDRTIIIEVNKVCLVLYSMA